VRVGGCIIGSLLIGQMQTFYFRCK